MSELIELARRILKDQKLQAHNQAARLAPLEDPLQPQQELQPELQPEPQPAILPGDWIRWHSPLFGLCSGQVSRVEGDRVLIARHPVVGVDAWIPVSWVIQGETE